MEVDGFEPFLHVEAGTALAHPGQVAVADDLGIGIVCAEALQQLYHRALLGLGAGVGGMAVAVEAALVADADAVGVVAEGVGARRLLGTAGKDFAVLRDVVVVADGLEPPRLVAGFEVFYREVPGDSRGGTVDDDKIDISHGILSVEC